MPKVKKPKAPPATVARTTNLKTLKKYGLTKEEWLAILTKQGGVCAICKRLPTYGRLCIDHEHVQGWKKMLPQHRKWFIRGLVCFFCNHYYLARAITVERAEAVVDYLKAYEVRKDMMT